MKNFPNWLKLLKGDDSDNDEEVSLLLSEPIGNEWGGGMSARRFGEALNSIPRKKPVALHINTLGGRVDDGTAMHNMIAARGNVTTIVIGFAASMGSVVAQAGAVRKMMPGTLMMIHNPYAQIGGDHRDAAKFAETLKKSKDNLVDLYSASNKKIGKRKISDLMDESTYMTPSEAVELGFADEAVTGDAAKNEIEPLAVMHAFKNLLPKVEATGGEKQNQNQNNTMKKLIAALAALVSLPEDSTDETAAPKIAVALTALIKDRDDLKSANTKHDEAKKTRVTNRVQKAIDDKLIKAERKDGLIAMGVADETNLDFIGDLTPAPTVPSKPEQKRGTPAPAASGETETEDSLRATFKTCANAKAGADEAVSIGIENAKAARKLRELRGHGSLFAAPVK